jgi:hypothetical protein
MPLLALHLYGLICKCQYPNRPAYFENMRLCQLDWNHQDPIDQKCITEIQTAKNASSNFKECNCPLECESSSLLYTNSITQYPTIWHYETKLKNFSEKHNLSYQEGSQCIAKVFIGYSQMEQTIISEEKKITFDELVASIGGTLGLFLGLSFLSLVEFVEILIQTILIFIQQKKSSIGV